MGRLIVISKWWNESLAHSLDFIRGKSLIKDGVSSGLTTGVAIENSFQATSFYVLGNELCPFAVPGDSGSLVFIQETMTVVGMVIMMEECQETKRQVCQILPIWQFYDWLVENVSQVHKYV